MLTVASDSGYRFKSVSVNAAKEGIEELSDLIAMMGDAVFSGSTDYSGLSCGIEGGKFVLAGEQGGENVAELSEANMTQFIPSYPYAAAGELSWSFSVWDGKIQGISVYRNTDFVTIFESAYGSVYTGSLPPNVIGLTTVEEGSKYSFIMPKKNVTVKAAFEEGASTHTITWKLDAKTLIETTEVEEGTVPSHAAAVKDEDVLYTYTFAGWTDGKNTYGAGTDLPVVTGEATYTAVSAAVRKDLFAAQSLTIQGGDIGVYFYLRLTEEEANVTTAAFTWDNNTLENVPVEADSNGTGLYRAKCHVAVAEMNIPIVATVTINGEEQDKTDVYSVKAYADVILSKEYKESYKGTGARSYENLERLVKTVQYWLLGSFLKAVCICPVGNEVLQ